MPLISLSFIDVYGYDIRPMHKKKLKFFLKCSLFEDCWMILWVLAGHFLFHLMLRYA
jgi:hypothetical protein